ncbi:basic leucine zipper 23-like [Papaver somniferum]|uniref:basic leucine zipper 23-like n=1 Tax=Papaver somniferum TaxID=3469 RepID=UPI000E700E57|nr:basic leucine zipper 23-like [Papaver somniferum]
MDDEELDFTNQVLKNMERHLLSSSAMDSFFDDTPADTHARTHTDTWNQPEQEHTSQNLELPHSPSYIHLGNKTFPVDRKTTTEEIDEFVDRTSKTHPHGNRESVGKYRERKKALQVSMKDELIRLRIVNQQLLKRLQGLVALEQEAARFKCLLVEIRGRIKGELGSFPFQKPATGNGVIHQNMLQSNLVGSYDVNQCDHQYAGLGNKNAEEAGVLGKGNNNSGFKEFLEFGQANVSTVTVDVIFLSFNHIAALWMFTYVTVDVIFLSYNHWNVGVYLSF